MPTQCGYFRILAKRPSRPLPSLTGSIPWPSAFFSLCLDRSVPSRAQTPGAKLIARVRQVLTDCFIFAAIYVLVMSVFLRLAAPFIVELFHAQGETAGLITFVCAHGGVLWLFLGAIFVANAAFNNLGSSHGTARKTSQGLVASYGFLLDIVPSASIARQSAEDCQCSIFTRFYEMPKVAMRSIIWQPNSTSRQKRRTRRSGPSCRRCRRGS